MLQTCGEWHPTFGDRATCQRNPGHEGAHERFHQGVWACWQGGSEWTRDAQTHFSTGVHGR
jgi:hypothetical protein